MAVNVTVCARTDVGCTRSSNEDAFVVADLTGGSLIDTQPLARFQIGPRGVLMAVSDGMGGHQAGEVASALVVESLRRAMSDGGAPPDDELLKQAVQQANRETWEASHAPGRGGMGATVTALYVGGPRAYLAEVGDSRAYVLRAGRLVQVTRDQSYVQLLIDSGALSPKDAAKAPFRNVILQAMGQSPDVQVALGKLDLRQRDCFVLCSDGLWQKATPEEIASVILGSRRLDEACDALIDLAKKRGGEDNITVILAGVSGDLPPLVPGENVIDTLEVVEEFTAPKGAK